MLIPATVAPAREEPPSAPRVYAKTRFVWIYGEPNADRQWIGFLRSGNSVPLRSTKPLAGPGCGAFYAIEPQGYVCADGRRATLDPNDPVYQAVAPFATKGDSPTPHRYAESLGAARYTTLPTEEQQTWRERDLRAHLRAVESARSGTEVKSLDGVDLSVPSVAPPSFPPLPITVFEDRKELTARSTVAYSSEARIGDRAFLLGADFAWIPKDRVRPYPAVQFQGVHLNEQLKLPLAFFRKEQRKKFRRADDGSFQETAESFTRKSYVELTGNAEGSKQDRYLETREPGIWLRAEDAVVPTPSANTPWATPNEVRPADANASARETWIQISIEGGWLIAYERGNPVFTTLISPGRGGAARPGEDPLKRSATPTGRYPITGKFVTSTMEAPNDLVHSDVPYAQNLTGPYALHAAYWHDNWGNPQSGGCVNLSPQDAKWLFDFTEPRVPQGWHGVRWLPQQGPATIVVLQR